VPPVSYPGNCFAFLCTQRRHLHLLASVSEYPGIYFAFDNEINAGRFFH